MDLRIVTVPYDSGFVGARMGAGPDALLDAGLVADLEAVGHSAEVSRIDLPTESFLPEVGAAFHVVRSLAGIVRDAVERTELPIVLAGNCITSVGVMSGLDAGRTGVIWFDSHADLNTPDTTESGFLDGMAVAVLTGRCWPALASSVPGFAPVPDPHLRFVAIRDLDPAERDLIGDVGIGVVRTPDLETGLSAHLDDLGRRVSDVYVHLDLDVIDPGTVRANQFSAPDGPSVPDLIAILKQIARRFRVRAVGLTAYDPSYDPDGRMPGIVTQLLTALLAADD